MTRAEAPRERSAPPDRGPAPRVSDLARPPWWRDPWCWIALLAVALLVAHSRGAPFGEPVADDFDFLHWTLLLDRHAFFDGGGSQSFWRPLAHQVYYSLLGNLMLAHPRSIAVLHVLLLAGVVVMLFAMMRRVWPGPAAATAACFPLLSESARALISWPSHFVEVGTLFFAVLALHEAAARRMSTALAALLASLLCKEAGLVAALLLPWMPALPPGRRERLRWLAATSAVVLAWGLAYLWVRSTWGLTLPHRLENNPEIAATPWLARFAWASWNSLRALASLPAAPGRGDGPILWALAALLFAAFVLALDRGGRQRTRSALPWIAWGSAWFVVFSAGLTAIYPIWAPVRSGFAAVGLGIAIVAFLASAHRGLVVALVAVRLVAFVLSPGAPPVVSPAPTESGAFIDFGRIVRLQRLMADTRTALASRHATLPHGARVGQFFLPRSVLYAYQGDKAIQLWYRDTTVRWMSFSEFGANPTVPLATIVQYQPHRVPQMTLVEPEAMRALLGASDHIRGSRWREALAELDRADSLQPDRSSTVFLGTVAAKRALALETLGDRAGAEREARRGMALWPDNFDSRYVLATLAFAEGRWPEAEAQLDTLLAAAPDDRSAAELRERVRAARRGTGR